mmetsp:Transcript_32696/g.93356  ORF Transcript_32696/g.93356 Transcript_32696/m.93356 type:complete len:252 (+) Transcript_32696:451-1206(+)
MDLDLPAQFQLQGLGLPALPQLLRHRRRRSPGGGAHGATARAVLLQGLERVARRAHRLAAHPVPRVVRLPHGQGRQRGERPGAGQPPGDARQAPRADPAGGGPPRRRQQARHPRRGVAGMLRGAGRRDDIPGRARRRCGARGASPRVHPAGHVEAGHADPPFPRGNRQGDAVELGEGHSAETDRRGLRRHLEAREGGNGVGPLDPGHRGQVDPRRPPPDHPGRLTRPHPGQAPSLSTCDSGSRSTLAAFRI